MLLENAEFSKYANWINYSVDVENFLQYRWISKILDTYCKAGLIDERTKKRFSAITNNYYSGGFKAILEYEIDMYRKGKRKTIEYGFPTDAIRRIEERHRAISNMSVAEAKKYCRENYQAIHTLLDEYENSLFIKAMKTF